MPGTEIEVIGRDRAWQEEGSPGWSLDNFIDYLGSGVYTRSGGQKIPTSVEDLARQLRSGTPGNLPIFYEGTNLPAYVPPKGPREQGYYGYWYPMSYYRRKGEVPPMEERDEPSGKDLIGEGLESLKREWRVAGRKLVGDLMEGVQHAGAVLDYPRALTIGLARAAGPFYTIDQALRDAWGGTQVSGLGWGIDVWQKHGKVLGTLAVGLGCIFDLATDPATYFLGPLSLTDDVGRYIATAEAKRAASVTLKEFSAEARKAVAKTVAEVMTQPGYYAADFARGHGATVDKVYGAITQIVLEKTPIRDLEQAQAVAMVYAKRYQAALQQGPRFWGKRLRVPELDQLIRDTDRPLDLRQPPRRMSEFMDEVDPIRAQRWGEVAEAYDIPETQLPAMEARSIYQETVGVSRPNIFSDPLAAEAADTVRAGVRSNQAVWERRALDLVRNRRLTLEDQTLVSQYMHIGAQVLRSEIAGLPQGSTINLAADAADNFLWRTFRGGAEVQAKLVPMAEAIVRQTPDITEEALSLRLRHRLSMGEKRIFDNVQRIRGAAQDVRAIFEGMYAEAQDRIRHWTQILGEQATSDIHVPHLDDYLPSMTLETAPRDTQRALGQLPGDMGRLFESAQDLHAVIDDLARAQRESRMPTRVSNLSLLLEAYINGPYKAVVQRDLITDHVVNTIGINKLRLRGQPGALTRLREAGFAEVARNPEKPGEELMQGLDNWLVPKDFRTRLVAETTRESLHAGSGAIAKLARLSLEAQGYVAPVVLATWNFIKAQAVEQPFNLANAIGYVPTRLRNAYEASQVAGRALALQVVDHFDFTNPIGLISQFDYWAQGNYVKEGGRFAGLLAKTFPGKTEAEILGLARKYSKELLDMGITDTGAFGALSKDIRNLHRISLRSVDRAGTLRRGLRQLELWLEHRGMSAEQIRELTMRVLTGVENASRATAYIALREEGLPPLQARLGTFRAFVNYAPEARTALEHVTSDFAWFMAYFVRRAQEWTGAGMNAPGLPKRFPALPYWTAKMLLENREGLDQQTQQAQLGGVEGLVQPGDYRHEWRIISDFSKPDWMKGRPEYRAIPWEMLPQEVQPTEEILLGQMGEISGQEIPTKLGQIAYTRMRVPLLEQPGDMYRAVTQPAEEMVSRFNPVVSAVWNLSNDGPEAALRGLPILGRIFQRPPDTPANQIERELREREANLLAHGEDPDPIDFSAAEDPYSVALLRQRQAAKSYKLFPLSIAPIDLTRASLWDLEELIRLYDEKGGGPISRDVLDAARNKRLYEIRGQHK